MARFGSWQFVGAATVGAMGKKEKRKAALQAAAAAAAAEGDEDAAASYTGQISDRTRNGASRRDELVERRDHFVETFVERLSDSAELNAAFYASGSEKEAKNAIRKVFGSDASRFIDNTGHWPHCPHCFSNNQARPAIT